MYILQLPELTRTGSTTKDEAHTVTPSGISGYTSLVDYNSESSATITSSTASLTFDYKESVSPGLIRLRTGTGSNLTSITISSSTDNTTFTDAQTIAVPNKDWHALPFQSYDRRYWKVEFTRTSAINYTIYAVEFYVISADFTKDEDHPYNFVPRLFNLPNTANVKTELAFEWHYLRQDLIDQLEDVFLSDNLAIIIPNPIDEPQNLYRARWTSNFDFYDTVVTDWTQGKTGAVIFQEL